MPASYPSQVATFPTHVNITEIIDAAHPNNIQNEVVAIETALGTNPTVSSAPSPGGTFDASGTAFTSVSARITNVETGVVSDSHNQYLRKAGDSGNVITPNSTSVKGLVVKATTGQTANLTEWQTAQGTVVTSIDANGNLIGTASGNVPLSTITAAGDLIIGNGNGVVTRLGVGANNYILASNGTKPYWTNTLSVQGTQGTQGLQGTTGSQGVQGVYGIQGSTGAQGIQGNQGTTGPQGAQGLQGTLGTQGIQGVSGSLSTSPIVYPTTSSSVGITIQGLASQSGDLQEWKASDGTVLAKLTSSGTFQTVIIDGGAA